MSKKASGIIGTDDVDFGIISGFPGYNSSGDPTAIKPNYLTQGSINTYRKTSGVIANRPGRKLYDASTDATIAGIKAAFVWHTSLSSTFVLEVCDGNLRFESDVTGTRTWYNLLTSLTLTSFVFDTWWDNTDKKDKLLMVNGSNVVYDWSGGIALFVSATPTVITLDRNAATAGFASSGTVTINGTDYTYTGISGSTLTGVGSSAAGEAADSVVVQTIYTLPNSSISSGPGTEFVNDYIKVINNQMYLGSYTSRLTYITKDSDYKSCAQSSPRLTGEGDTLTLDDNGRGIGVKKGAAHIFAGSGNLYRVTFNQITVGSTLSEQTKVEKIPLGSELSAKSHDFIDSLSDNLIYLDQTNQVRVFGSFSQMVTDRPVILSRDVMDELSLTDFTGGHLKVIADKRGDNIYITAPNSSYVYWFQEIAMLNAVENLSVERLWQPPQIWGVSRVLAVPDSNGDEKLVGFSNINPQAYYLWETDQWVDDAPSDSLPYISIALFAYQNGGRRQGKIIFDKTYFEGYCTQGTNLYSGFYYDYQGSTTVTSPIISNIDSRFQTSQLFSGVVPPSLGDASLGENPLGDGLNTALDDHFTLPKFRTIIGTQVNDCYEFATMLYSQEAGDRWELLCYGSNIRLSQSEPIEIIKI